jgi:pseudouridine-5'-phosphate glycosidase
MTQGPVKPRLGEEVAGALAAGWPVVALESTIITHGMPYPESLATALSVEEEVRANGAVPATIAVIDGVPRAGLDKATIERLGTDGESVVKASGRDLAAAMLRKLSAGTTVSATMRIAHLAGIPVFATGGIGGVHRGVERSFDISADLSELAQTPVAVVCAGAKSILDIPKTLEYLETWRVPVIAYCTDEFPAFYSNASGARAPERLDTPREIAEAIVLHRRLGSGTGLLIANPIPTEAALTGAGIDQAIEAATRDAEAQGIGGKELTPFLLSRINEITGGASLKANIALIRNNAALAARIAVAYAELPRVSS